MQDEFFAEVWMGKNWSCCKQLLDGVKSLLAFSGPDKRFVLSLKLVQWFCYFGQVLYKVSIVRDHSKKSEYFGKVLWSSHVSYCTDFGWIGLNTISRYYKTKIFSRATCKVAFLQFDLEIDFFEPCKSLLDML